MGAKPRTDALNSGAKYYFTGKPCAHGHITARRVLTRACIACEAETTKKRAKERDTMGARIARTRMQMRITQSDLAKSIKVTQSYMCRIESDRQDPTIWVVAEIAKELDVSIDYLTCRTDRMDVNYE